MSAPKYDIDMYNITVLIGWLLTLPGELELSSNAQFHRLHKLGRKASAMIGLDASVQLIDQPPVYIRQLDHAPLIDALCAAGLVLVKPKYKPAYYQRDEADPDDRDGDKRMKPVAFSVSAACVTAATLHAALQSVGVQSVRTTRYNNKTPIGEWIAAHAPTMVTEPWCESVLDISTTVCVGDGKSIPLLGVESGRAVQTMELLGALGQGCGSLLLNQIQLGGGLRLEAGCVYPSKLVHHLKARGMSSQPPATGSVRAAANYRRNVVEFLEDWLRLVESDACPDLGFLRFEMRVVVNHALFHGTWRELVQRVAVDSPETLEQRYACKSLKVRGVLVGVADYATALRESIRRLCEPKYGVGFAISGKMSRNAVKLRILDLHAQAGLHGGMNVCNCINRAATQLFLDPTRAQVDEGGSVHDADYVFVEPQVPPLPPRQQLAPAPRPHVLVVGGQISLRAADSYIKQLDKAQMREKFGEPFLQPEITAVDSLRRTIQAPQPAQRLQTLFGEASQAEFRAAHPVLTDADALRIQMYAVLDIIPRGQFKFTVRRKGQFVKNCIANSIELLLDHMYINHRNDWQTFDKKKTLNLSH